MIKIAKIIGTKLETAEVIEDEYPFYQEYVDLLERMKEKGCHSMIITLEEGLQVLFTVKETQ